MTQAWGLPGGNGMTRLSRSHRATQNRAMELTFKPMTESWAGGIVGWRYPSPYDFYNAPDDIPAGYIEGMLSQESPHWGVVDLTGELIGFVAIGKEAQVPGGDYSADATDIGIGLRPDRCGQGLGRQVVAAFIEFLEARYGPSSYRATIAAFNQRSLKTFLALGLTETSQFTTNPAGTSIDWIIVMKENS